MSFSQDVKREIISLTPKARHCRLSMLAAVINGAGRVSGVRGSPSLTLKTESRDVAEWAAALLAGDFRMHSETYVKGAAYMVAADDARDALSAAGLWSAEKGHSRRIDTLLTSRDCCRKAYLAGTFLACGTVSDPGKAYHCEFVAAGLEYAEELKRLWEGFGLSPKSLSRKSRSGLALYFKDGEQIADILKITGAAGSLMRFEDARILKEMGNKINRTANFGVANVDKSISAAVRQIEDINLIAGRMGLSALPPQLSEMAAARTGNPEISLKELGEALSPPVSKSGVNHRLRKIREIADRLRAVDKE